MRSLLLRRVHPGVTFCAELRARRKSLSDICKDTGLNYKRAWYFSNGKKKLSNSDLLKISKFFGNGIDFWVNLQRNYYHR